MMLDVGRDLYSKRLKTMVELPSCTLESEISEWSYEAFLDLGLLLYQKALKTKF